MWFLLKHLIKMKKFNKFFSLINITFSNKQHYLFPLYSISDNSRTFTFYILNLSIIFFFAHSLTEYFDRYIEIYS